MTPLDQVKSEVVDHKGEQPPTRILLPVRLINSEEEQRRIDELLRIVDEPLKVGYLGKYNS